MSSYFLPVFDGSTYFNLHLNMVSQLKPDIFKSIDKKRQINTKHPKDKARHWSLYLQRYVLKVKINMRG